MSAGRLKFPEVGHIGVVVRDIERVVRYYSSVFGIGPFEVYDFVPFKAWIYGKEAKPFKLKIAVADMGSVKLELIEVIHGDPPHRAFLNTHGEGVQHIAFYVENYDEWKSYAQGGGIDLLFEAEIEDEVRGRRRAFYMNSAEIGGVLFEIIGREKKS
jgi:catechol 2,3-dioxygenase-like lactoylglutathione lyase family enzyme